MRIEMLFGLFSVLVVAGIFFLVIYLVVSVIKGMARGVKHVFVGGPGTDQGQVSAVRTWSHRDVRSPDARPMVCRNERCRKSNVPEAGYCSRCGQPLTRRDRTPTGVAY